MKTKNFDYYFSNNIFKKLNQNKYIYVFSIVLYKIVYKIKKIILPIKTNFFFK
jgi:hypothetical protein